MKRNSRRNDGNGRSFFPTDHGRLEPRTLSPDGRYLLLSDLHLGDGRRVDLFVGNDQAFVTMLEALSGEVDAVILNGDIFDAAETTRAEPIRRAHPKAIDALAAVAERIPLHHVVGNHDSLAFIRELLPAARPCSEVRLGDEAWITHGHRFDVHFVDGPLDGKGHIALRAHAWVEERMGEEIRLPFSHYDNRANRFAHWVFYRYTMASLLAAQVMARLGRPDHLRRWAAHHDFWARSQWGDAHGLLLPALRALAESPYRVLFTGHCHQAGLIDHFPARPTEAVSGEPIDDWRGSERRAPRPEALAGKTYVNLGSWTFHETTYAIWDRGAVTLRDWRTGATIGDRTYRYALGVDPICGMREWWQRYYCGRLRYDTAQLARDRSAIDPVFFQQVVEEA